MTGNQPHSDRKDRDAPTPVEPSTAEASRLLAQRLAQEESVVAHGTIPFRPGPEPEPDRRRRRVRPAVVVAVVLAVVLGVAVVLALVVG